MIGITERAKKELKELLTEKVDNPEARLRLRTNEEGKLGIGIDIEKPDDMVIEYKGDSLLVVDAKLADSLENVAIDVVDSDKDRQFVIINRPQ